MFARLIAAFAARPVNRLSWSNRFQPAAMREWEQDRGFNPSRDLCW